ncbi:MAG TPA: DUF2127 domain-containing protein [Minicystis sp.]|nr:DUF2127 domain-containing protein [Minicystis sp.]
MAAGRGRGRGWLTAIGVFKLFKAVALVALGVAALRLANDDAPADVLRWAAAFSMDPHNRFLHVALVKVAGLSGKRLDEIGVGTFVYAAVFSVEGIGLLLAKSWAEYLTIGVTVSFIPLEIIETVRRATAPRVVTLVLNAAVVVYLVVRVHHERRERRGRHERRDAHAPAPSGGAA